MKEACVLVLLGWNAWTDLKKKQISLVSVGVFSCYGVLQAVLGGEMGWKYFASLGVGVFFLLIGMMTKGALGLGDGLLLMALGTVLDPEELLMVSLIGLLLCAMAALVLLVVFRKGRNAEIPFVPFLLAGYVGGLFIWYGS